MPKQQPEVARILSLVREMEAVSGPVRARWDVIREVRNRTHAIEIPEVYRKTTKVVRTHWVGDILRRIKASLTVNFPSYTVPPSGPSPARQANASLREKWSNVALMEMDSARLPKRPWPTMIDHAVTYGIGIPKIVYTPTTWHDYPTARMTYGKGIGRLTDDEKKQLDDSREEFKKGKFPFAWQAVDPRGWWGWYSEGRLTECVEVSERTIGDIMGAYPVAYDGTTGKLVPANISEPYAPHGAPSNSYRERRTFIEHWDDTWVTYCLDDGTVLKQFKHGYGKPPYFPFYGLSNASADPGMEMESVVEHIVDMVKLYDNLLTMWQNWAYISAYPMAFLSGPESSQFPFMDAPPDGVAEGQKGPELEIVPGKITLLPPGYKAEWFVPPPIGQDVVRVSEVLKGFIEEVIPNVMKGLGAADQAGYAINQLIVAARMVYDPITDNAALALQQAMQFVWGLIEHKVGEKVYVWGQNPEDATRGNQWLGLGPDDIYRYYAVTCNIESLLPSNLIAEGQFGLMQQQGGAIPMRFHLERFLRVPNPEDLQDELWVEKEINDPSSPLYAWMRNRALKKAEMLDLIEEAQRAEALAQVPLPTGIGQRMGEGGMPPGQPVGMPGPQGQAPMPGMGMPLTPQAPMPSGGMPEPGPTGFGPGRAPGVERQPTTQGLPGGMPGQM